MSDRFDLPRGRVLPVSAVELHVLPGDHPFAEQHRAAAAANWTREVAAKPALFDGPITLFSSMRIEDGRLVGTCHMTRYSSFLHWRSMRGQRDGEHAYAHALIVSADGKLVAARMGPRTVHAGKVYFAAGSCDAGDVRGSMIDVDWNMAREVAEETGLDLSAMQAENGYHIYSIESGTVIIRRYVSVETAAELARRVAEHVARDAEPEIEGAVIIATGARPDDAFADHMRAIVDWHFATVDDGTFGAGA